MQIWGWIMFNWLWVTLWLVVGVATTYFVLSDELPIKKYDKDLYGEYYKMTAYHDPHFTWGKTVIEVLPFPLLGALLLVIIWPINILILLWMHMAKD
ncbi:MAG: hypothetical protein Q7S52_04210 [bacterium]|nr:hypothetical protein [bacterium]